MEPRLILYLAAVVILVVASVTAMADQSGRLVGVHEIPPFVLDRVELPWGQSRDRGTKSGLTRPGQAATAG